MTLIPLNDLKRQNAQIGAELNDALLRVAASGWYLFGPELEAFESEYAAFCHAKFCVGVGNGTDAIEIALKSLKVSVNDEVITAANAGMYSTTAIRAIGAVPVFADIDSASETLDPVSVRAKLTPRTKAIIVTHLYGRMSRMDEFAELSLRHGVALVEDCAQAHGGTYAGRSAGSWGDVACFSFYPTKNLGALGDAGAIVTSDSQIAHRARLLRQYGWTSKYHSRITGGGNSRLDELQAAVLRVKLPHLSRWNERRLDIARRYCDGFIGVSPDILQLPALDNSVFHLYVVRSRDRDSLLASLRAVGVGCDVHYPVPDHLQESSSDLGYRHGDLPETERAAAEVLTLPCFPELDIKEIESVIEAVLKLCRH